MLWCFRTLTLTSLKGEGDTELPKTPLLCGVADGGGVHQYQSHPGGWGWLTKISWTLLSLRWGKTTVYNIRQMISNTIQKQERKNLSTWNWQFKYVQNRVFTEVPPKNVSMTAYSQDVPREDCTTILSKNLASAHQTQLPTWLQGEGCSTLFLRLGSLLGWTSTAGTHLTTWGIRCSPFRSRCLKGI